LLVGPSEVALLATYSDPLYCEGMANADKVVGYEFYRGFYADLEKRRVLKNGKQLDIPLTQMEFAVLEFFLGAPGKVIARKAVPPLGETTERPYVDNYLSKITSKLGLRKHELFKLTRQVGYSLEAKVRRIFASDQQEGGDIFKAAEMHFNTHTVDSMRASLKQSLRTLEINPYGLPEAHVRAAYVYINLSEAAYSAEPPDKVIPEARQHALDALKIDPTSSTALGVLGLISWIYDYDWEKAKTQLEGALELDPNDAATLLSYAHFLVCSARPDEAVKAVEKAVRIAPTDQIIHASVGWMHLLAGDVQGAIELGEKTTFLYPNLPPAYVLLGFAYEAAERYSDARRHYEISFEKEYSPAALASLGHLLAKLGDRRGALATLDKLDQLYKQGSISYIPSYFRALVFAGLNEVEACLDALEHACEQHCDWLIHLAVERRWDPVRKSARFKQLAQRIGVTTPPDLTLGAQN
jgi:tetratricopeptide (TPR) repeat protein